MTSPICVVFDCDGVLLDSNRMKTQAFCDILADYPADAVARFLAYQTTAFGLSRYRMIDAFFDQHLGRPARDGEKQGLLDAFGRECRQRYPRQPVTDGAHETLEALASQGVPMFVVSGSDEVELISVLEEIGMSRYFQRVFGSPETKVANLKRVAEELSEHHAVTFVGDAKADWRASRDHGCDFVYVAPWAADPETMQTLKQEHGFKEISKLPELLKLLTLEKHEAATAKEVL